MLILLFFGLFLGLIIDIIWWVKPWSKSDKFQSHEHYHVALELVILFIILEYLTNSTFTIVILGMSFSFLLGEWGQLKEIKKTKVVPGHPFAYGSTHFIKSTIIGVILVGIIICMVSFGSVVL